MIFFVFMDNVKLALSVSDEIGRTLLHNATMQGNHELVKKLLFMGADPNAVDIYGKTPLYFSVIRQDLDCIDTILKYKPDLTAGTSVNMVVAVVMQHPSKEIREKILIYAKSEHIRFENWKKIFLSSAESAYRTKTMNFDEIRTFLIELGFNITSMILEDVM